MKVLVIGSIGNLGPYVVESLQADHDLKLADLGDPRGGSGSTSSRWVEKNVHIKPFYPDIMRESHNCVKLDVANLEQVIEASEGMDAIVNLSVLREDRKLAFDVNFRGAYNVIVAAAKHDIRRVINTGAHFTIAGPSYEHYDYDIGEDIPPQPGVKMYPLTKSLGLEASRVLSERYETYVLWLLFYNFFNPEDVAPQHHAPFLVDWNDAANAVRRALDVDLETLPSKCESFYISTDIPHEKFSNKKAKHFLGWSPTTQLENIWKK